MKRKEKSLFLTRVAIAAQAPADVFGVVTVLLRKQKESERERKVKKL